MKELGMENQQEQELNNEELYQLMNDEKMYKHQPSQSGESDCCSAPVVDDYELCSECKDHCGRLSTTDIDQKPLTKKNKIMKTSIKEELTEYIKDNLETFPYAQKEDLHFHLFNQDYYIIGYYQCDEWLKEHNLSPFEAIGIIKEYELENFGEITTDISSSEKVVNMLVYIYGEELLCEMELI